MSITSMANMTENIPDYTWSSFFVILTDAHLPDAQALAEGTLLMSTVIRNGSEFNYTCLRSDQFIYGHEF